jgi:hypothetical protein
MVSQRRRVQELAAEAGHDDLAWNELVRLLTPFVDEHLSAQDLASVHEEHLRRAVWRALARRLELRTPPADVTEWLVQRLAIELGRGPLRLVPGSDDPADDVRERRVLVERRRWYRATVDRRQVATPDALAARLRHARRTSGRLPLGREG